VFGFAGIFSDVPVLGTYNYEGDMLVRHVKCSQKEIILTFIQAKYNNALSIILIESTLKNFKEAFDIPVSYSILSIPR
jgi:hypothetical protein